MVGIKSLSAQGDIGEIYYRDGLVESTKTTLVLVPQLAQQRSVVRGQPDDRRYQPQPWWLGGPTHGPHQESLAGQLSEYDGATEHRLPRTVGTSHSHPQLPPAQPHDRASQEWFRYMQRST